jgi:hypothetical protein
MLKRIDRQNKLYYQILTKIFSTASNNGSLNNEIVRISSIYNRGSLLLQNVVIPLEEFFFVDVTFFKKFNIKVNKVSIRESVF